MVADPPGRHQSCLLPLDYITFDILVGIRYLSRVIIKTNRPFLYQTIIACHGRGGAE
jgi:hypothetical protein